MSVVQAPCFCETPFIANSSTQSLIKRFRCPRNDTEEVIPTTDKSPQQTPQPYEDRIYPQLGFLSYLFFQLKVWNWWTFNNDCTNSEVKGRAPGVSVLKEIAFPRRSRLHRNLTSAVKLSCTGSCFSLYTFTILSTLSSTCLRRTPKREVHLRALSGFLDTNIFWFTAIHTKLVIYFLDAGDKHLY